MVKTGPAAALLDSSVDGAPFVGIEEYEDDDDMLVDHADVSLYQVR